MHELVEEGKVSIRYVKSKNQMTDLSMKQLSKHRHMDLDGKVIIFLREENLRCCCCCFLTLTDPLRIQPWSQDRRNQTKSTGNRR